ncbi:hypothetical protein AKJ50_01660 [candidate division MSBL1 archaeon SCGC-AAA382A13]|uniref:Methionine aminopeptidase n=1 Tax=candidate division MSBL1 archaeon SCGC-AAA382A13 TaxID=1698279 RepID=A0A133VFG9_9EURY|nr:hypothetical protein AKJ50_01660 [candidate division MSBL1 archaeon SCGC-AAA382A13]
MVKKLSEEEVETYKKAGKLAAEVMDKALKMVEPEEKLFDIAEQVEDTIREKGEKPAFPCNISINEKAAHYSPPGDDETEIQAEDLVKIDIGVHFDGYIADMARSVFVEEEKNPEEEEDESVKKKKDMIRTINQVLEKATDAVEPGINVGEIGRIIQETAEQHGYNPISNLTGHNLERWSLHGGVSIPNVEEDTDEVLEEGDVVALEPFITDGEGEVEEMPEVYIFRCRNKSGVSGRMAQQTLREIKNNYGNLPFAERWLTEDLSMIRLQITLRELLSSEALRPYYVLKEVDNGVVAQAEDTMIVTEEGCEVIT